jgi:hypothetical protein
VLSQASKKFTLPLLRAQPLNPFLSRAVAESTSMRSSERDQAAACPSHHVIIHLFCVNRVSMAGTSVMAALAFRGQQAFRSCHQQSAWSLQLPDG